MNDEQLVVTYPFKGERHEGIPHHFYITGFGYQMKAWEIDGEMQLPFTISSQKQYDLFAFSGTYNEKLGKPELLLSFPKFQLMISDEDDNLGRFQNSWDRLLKFIAALKNMDLSYSNLKRLAKKSD